MECCFVLAVVVEWMGKELVSIWCASSGYVLCVNMCYFVLFIIYNDPVHSQWKWQLIPTFICSYHSSSFTMISKYSFWWASSENIHIFYLFVRPKCWTMVIISHFMTLCEANSLTTTFYTTLPKFSHYYAWKVLLWLKRTWNFLRNIPNGLTILDYDFCTGTPTLALTFTNHFLIDAII